MLVTSTESINRQRNLLRGSLTRRSSFGGQTDRCSIMRSNYGHCRTMRNRNSVNNKIITLDLHYSVVL